MNKAKMLNDIELYKVGDITKEDIEQSLDALINSQNSGKPLVSGELCPRCNSPLIYKKVHTQGYSCNNCFHDWV